MKLLRLELNGFKSFPRKTTLEFHRGITSIVGPNGCGKSNIVDSIRWVLGEQNPRSLRGERMDDAIFKGTTTRKPLGLADVTITLSNENGELPVPYQEVSLTRRLHRSGESQYLINKNQMRLKDITDLISGTGIGLSEYSLIDQKLVDTILDDSTNNRRELIEEAAGIASYKRKRHLARRKLEAVENDLRRLGDIVSEVERTVGSLGRHVKKARRYQAYREKQKELDLLLTSRRLSLLSRENQEVSGRRGQMEERVREYRSLVEERTRKIAEIRELVAKLEEETRKRRLEIDSSLARKNELDGDLRLARERLRLSRERLGSLGTEREELKKKKASILEEKQRIETRSGEVKAGLEQSEERFRLQESKTREFSRRLEEKQTLLVSIEKELEEDYRTSVREEARKVSLREDIGQLMKRKAEMEPLLAGESGEVEKMAKEGDDLAGEIEKLSQIVGTLQTELRETEKKRHDLLVRKDSFTRLERESELELNNIKARLESMKGESGEERISSAVRSAVEFGRKLGKSVWRASDLLTVRRTAGPGFIEYFERKTNCVIAEDLNTALLLVSELKKRKIGACSIVPLDIPVPDLKSCPELDGAVPARDLVGCQERFVPVRDLLFGNMQIVPHDADMRELSRLSVGGLDFISRDGTFFVSRCILSAGNNEHRSGDAIQELKIQGEHLMQKLSEACTGLEEVEGFIQEVERGKSKLEAHLQGHSSELSGIETRAHQVAVELVSRSRDKNRLRSEYDSIISLLEKKGSQLRIVEETLSGRTARLDDLREKHDELVGEFKELSDREKQESGLLSDCKIDMVALSSRLREVEILEDNLSAQIQALESEFENREVEEKNLNEKIEGLLVHIKDLENGFEAERLRIEDLNTILRESEKRLRTKREETERDSTDIEMMRAALDELLQERNDLIIREKELSLTLESLTSRIENEWDIKLDLEQIASEASEEAVIEDLEQELADIKRKIHFMGSVNMAALEEYEQEKERFDFLTAQRADLVQSKDDLEKTIRKLNRIARERFRETFAEVKKNFTRIFSTLFRGGEAGLELINELDPLESGIRIFARPRGKKEQAIELLSGGERALSAIAFLFSLYLVKSSPFCIFDEVDAPLDDSNILRFTSMLREYSDRTQFVVITHNKRTMEAADYMYGISMEEPGVSKVVSIKLNGNGRKEGHQQEEEVTVVDEAVV